MAAYEEIAMPPTQLVRENKDLVRSQKDVPIALALLAGEADIFVTMDRDFTDPGAVADRFQERVRIMLPAGFLRHVLGWSPEALEAIRAQPGRSCWALRRSQEGEGGGRRAGPTPVG